MARRKRVKKKYIEFESCSMDDAKNHIKQFLKTILPQFGLQNRSDYIVTNDFLFIRHLKEKTGKVLIALKEAFPVFNFYWDSPRILVWF